MGRFFDYIIIFLFVAISGNPFICYWSWGAVFLLCLFFIAFTMQGHFKAILKGFNETKKYLLLFCALFLLQLLFCTDISVATQINYLFKILLGGLIYTYYGGRFKYLYLNILTIVAFISLLLYPLVMNGFTFGNPFGTGFSTSSTLHTLILYNYDTEFNLDRNTGMFWEPGSFACYLCLVPVFFINNPMELVKKYRIKSLILFFALLSTRSTTGFIVFAAIMFFVFMKSLKSVAITSIIGYAILILLSSVITDKITKDTATVDNLTLGKTVDYDGYNTENRLGTIYFLVPLISQHPIVGNGLNPEAMYSTMKYMLLLDHIGLGNGFFTYWASLGLLGLLFYFGGIYLYWKIPKKQKLISILILVLLLQGEPLLIYPVVMGLPFLRH